MDATVNFSFLGMVFFNSYKYSWFVCFFWITVKLLVNSLILSDLDFNACQVGLELCPVQ